jgi:ribosomal protein S18 acetylase RimI-like enzyme
VPLAAGLVPRRPTVDDHERVLSAIVEWWADHRGAGLASLLPRLFFQHFATTSWVLDDDRGDLRGFLIGFRSFDNPDVAYIHFVGVDPDLRGRGVGRSLYEMFFADMAASGCTIVNAITGPANTGSQAFHRALGFWVGKTLPSYDGPGEARVPMSRAISPVQQP